MMDVLDRIGVHLPSLVIYLVNFLVLWGVLHFVAFRPFMHRLWQRTLEEEELKAGMKELQRLREEAQESRDLVLAQAREERETMLKAAEELRDNLVKDGVEQGKQAKERLFRQAQEQVLLESLKAHQDLYDSYVELVLAASERALGKALLDEAMQQKLIAEANRELADLAQELSSLLPKGWALVTTAVPLVQECQDKISDSLAKIVGKPVRTVFLVEPSVLGGLSLRTGDALLDVTLQGKLEQLRRHLLSPRVDVP